MIKFYKVSLEQYIEDRAKTAINGETEEDFIREYGNIQLPVRATAGSAGYDFKIPYSTIVSSESQVIPTGIRAEMIEGIVLKIYPRSGLGFKYMMNLDNQCGIIDEDYFFADNEGHIMAKVHSDKTFQLCEGDRFIQGIFTSYFVTDDDKATSKRTGGMGSTGTN